MQNIFLKRYMESKTIKNYVNYIKSFDQSPFMLYNSDAV